jgi:Ni,Fe-hydrogenase I cytochrome b subunit
VFFKKLAYYINPLNLFRKEKEENVNLRVMHGINKISFMMFLVCLVYMIVRFALR